jgi:hypothetical protein
MNRRIPAGWVAVAAVLAVAILAPSGAAAKVKKVAFVATYAGTANVQVDGNVANISANGSGKGTLLGSGKITGTGTGDSSQQPCVPFTGPGVMTGTAGTKLTFTVPAGAQGCGDEAGQVFSVVGHATVTKGTGKLLKAKGTLKFTGTYDRGAGTFSVTFKGTLTQ